MGSSSSRQGTVTLPESSAGTSNRAISSSVGTEKLSIRPDYIKQLNPSVWEIHKPLSGVPKVEVLLFHGAQLSDDKEAFWTTWLSRDETGVWPKNWLARKFPEARILSISYDASLRKSPGQLDLYLTVENLMHDILRSAEHAVLNFNQSMMELLRMLNPEISRISDDFTNLRKHIYKTLTTKAIYANRNTKLRVFEEIEVTPEASAREDVDQFYTYDVDTYDVDHFDVSRAKNNRSCPTYMWLSALVDEHYSSANRSNKIRHPRNTVGLEKKVNKVLECLGVHGDTIESEARATLLYGTGGIGKTTLGRAVCSKIPISEFVVEVELRENPVVEIVQMDIYEQLSGEVKKVSSYYQGQEKLQEQLSKCHGTVLLFIDNVSDKDDLKKLLPDGLDLPDKSRLVVTSRDHGVSETLADIVGVCKAFAVAELEVSDSKTLFLQHLQFPPDDKDNEIAAILNICRGLPLALELVGKSPRFASERSTWRKVINGLTNECRIYDGRKDFGKTLHGVLKWSYEQLSEGSKCVFLDICFCFRDANWNVVKFLFPEEEVKSLLDLSLVKKVQWQRVTESEVKEPVENNHVLFFHHWKRYGLMESVYAPSELQMHDLIVALGKSESTSSMTRVLIDLSLPIETYIENDLQVCHSVEALVMKADRGDNVNIPARTLDDMHEGLRILILTDCVDRIDRCDKVPGNLQICSTEGVGSGSLFPYPGISGSKKLRVLDIERCNGAFLEKVQLPASLEICRLRDVSGLRAFSPGAFEECVHLHSLVILKCDDLEKLPSSVGCLEGLVYLELSRCPDLKKLPKCISQLRDLRVFFINSCRKLRKLPAGFGNLHSLANLSLDSCSRLMKLPDDFGNLSALRELSLRACTRLTKLPASFGNLVNLEDLSLLCCENLEALPDNLVRLQRLTFLDLGYCARLTELPTGLGELASLLKLDLKGCESLQLFPDSIVRLERLASLSMGGYRLTELPTFLDNLVALKMLDLDGCEGLESLPDSVVRLEHLTLLSLRGCSQLTALPTNLGNLDALEELFLNDCVSLEALPDSVVRLAHLTDLDLKECAGLKELPRGLGDLAALKTLGLRDCRNLGALPDSVVRLAHLTDLDLEGCAGLKELPRGLGDLVALKTLGLSDCRNLGALPPSIVACSRLEVLNVDGCTKFMQLPHDLGNLPMLEFLCLAGCMNLESLPESLLRLGRIQTMGISGCVRLQQSQVVETLRQRGIEIRRFLG